MRFVAKNSTSQLHKYRNPQRSLPDTPTFCTSLQRQGAQLPARNLSISTSHPPGEMLIALYANSGEGCACAERRGLVKQTWLTSSLHRSPSANLSWRECLRITRWQMTFAGPDPAGSRPRCRC